MSDTKWTPGPWTAHKNQKVRVYGRGYAVCELTGGEIQRDKANARLMAAAPDLYDDAHALAMLAIQNKAYTLDDEFGQAVDNMLGTLAKARGES